MGIKVLFCDDNKNYIKLIKAIDIENVIGMLRDQTGADKYFAERFLGRLSSESDIELVGIRTQKYDEMLNQIEANHSDAKILLLDCALDGDTGGSPFAICKKVFNSITCNKDRVCILATSHDSDAVHKKLPDKCGKEFIEGGKGLQYLDEDQTEQIGILKNNIIQGILLYEKSQSGDKYDGFIYKLMSKDGYSKHSGNIEPTKSDLAREKLFKEYFDTIPWSLELSAIIADMADSKRKQLDLRSAWFLAQMKFESLFGDTENPFNVVGDVRFKDRWDKNNEKYFMPCQGIDDRTKSLLAFGNMCEKLFQHDKEKNEDNTKKIVLKKATLEIGGKGEHRIVFELDWPMNDVIKNYNTFCARLLASIQSKNSGEESDHSTSSAIVAFIISTLPTCTFDSNTFIGGLNTELVIEELKDGKRSLFKFKDL